MSANHLSVTSRWAKSYLFGCKTASLHKCTRLHGIVKQSRNWGMAINIKNMIKPCKQTFQVTHHVEEFNGTCSMLPDNKLYANASGWTWKTQGHQGIVRWSNTSFALHQFSLRRASSSNAWRDGVRRVVSLKFKSHSSNPGWYQRI